MSARAYLFSLEQIGIKLGLEQIRALLAALDHPERDYPSIVVAGTSKNCMTGCAQWCPDRTAMPS